ncbi:MAG: dihydrolipoamide acetyltransferase family protein, partial [Flavobacteriaceae bacterium]
EGVLMEKRFNIDDVIKVGEVVAVIKTEGTEDIAVSNDEEPVDQIDNVEVDAVHVLENEITQVQETIAVPAQNFSTSERFYSPLVKNIAKEEGVSMDELEAVVGTGKEGRVTKNDIKAFLENRSSNGNSISNAPEANSNIPQTETQNTTEINPTAALSAEDEVIPLSRMGKLIAKHMVTSISTSAHVQSFVEVDVTNIVNWRNNVKKAFGEREGEKLTFTPIFMEAVAMALKKYPLMNISLDGDKVIKKKSINIGMAAALSDGNLIVPVIKNADQLNLVGMAKIVNDLANRARNNQLKPEEVQDGTYTVTNVGSFGSIFGTPIINQPQVGILALGAIRKIPAVIETDQGEYIGIRSKMFLSHSYDHRVVNGALGGMFVKTVADYLEGWDINREI